MKGTATIKVAFRIFDITLKNPHTNSFCHIILLIIIWNCGSNAYHWGLKLFYNLQNYTEFYEINWTLLLFPYAQVFVGSHGVLTLHVTTGRTFWSRCVINDFNTILVKQFMTRQTKQIKSAILRHSWNVERLIEHIRQNVAWELSCEEWLERIVKWIWTASRGRWREAASRSENIIRTSKPNI
jgi:hypothetical protein